MKNITDPRDKELVSRLLKVIRGSLAKLKGGEYMSGPELVIFLTESEKTRLDEVLR